jgi:hypothetical protein
LEELGPADTALVLGIGQDAKAKPYSRPLKRQNDLLATMRGEWKDP